MVSGCIHQIRKFDLDIDAVGVLIVRGHFDSSVMSGGEFGKGRDGLVSFVGGYERFGAVGLQGD